MSMRLGVRHIGYLTILIYWFPSNAIGYLWGFALLFLILLAKPNWFKRISAVQKKILLLGLIFWFLIGISFIINWIVTGSSFNNLFWSCFTYGGTFSVLFGLLALPISKESDLRKILMFSIYVSIFQTFLGYIQMVQAQSFSSLNPFSGGIDAGDFFVGTTFDPGIGNLVAIKISLMFFMFLPVWLRHKSIKNSIILTTLLMGWILPSALYTLLIGAVVLLYFFFWKQLIAIFRTSRLRTRFFYIAMCGIISVATFMAVQPGNVKYITVSLYAAYSTILDLPEKRQTVRKVIYYRRTLIDLPQEFPSQLFWGVGPGNYSSRAGWIVSGEYLLNQPSYIQVTPSKAAQKYLIPIWSKKLISDKFKGAGSIIHQPFSTWLSVFSEFGLVALIIFIMIFSSFNRDFVNVEKSDNFFLIDLATGLRMCLFYISLLFFIDNLFEWPIVMGQFFLFACALLTVHHRSKSLAW